MKLLRVITGILILLMTTTSCSEEKKIIRYGLTPATIEIKGDTAYVTGTLGKIFYHKFEKVVAEHPELKTVVLLEIPGSVNDYWNIKSCELLFEKGLNTKLLSTSVVESGGSDLFVSGKKLYMDEGAKIGVHSWAGAFKPAIEFPKESNAHKMFLELYEKVEIDTSFYWFTLEVAPASEMHYMTPTEIQKYLGNKLVVK